MLPLEVPKDIRAQLGSPRRRNLVPCGSAQRSCFDSVAKQAHVAQLSSDPLQEQAILGVEMGVVLTMPVLQPTGLGTRSRCRTVQIELTGIL